VHAGQASQAARAAELDAALAEGRERQETLDAELEAQRVAQAEQATVRQQAERTVLECRSRLDSLAEIEAGYEGFAEHVRTFLEWAQAHPEQRAELGIVGPLADLVRVPAEVAVWSGDYLAPHLETVVIQSAAALPRLAEQVQALDTGGVRFLALDALPAAVNGHGHQDHGGNGNGYPALAELLGGEAPARELLDTLFAATRVLPAERAPYPLPAPLDAQHEWLAADGAFHIDGRARVTLGQAGSPGAGLLRRRAEMDQLGERLAALEAETERHRETAEALAERLRLLEVQRREHEERSAELALARKAAEQELAQAQRETQRLEQVREGVQREQGQFEAELERYRAQQGELSGEQERWRALRTELEGELAGLRTQVEAARAEQQEQAAQLTERKVEHGRVASRLESLRARLAESAREQEEAAGRLEETEAALAGQEARVTAGVEAIAALEARQKAHHAELEALRLAERERRQAFDALAEHHRALGERAKASQRAHEANQQRLHEIELKLTAERMRLEQHAAALAELPQREPGEPAGGSGLDASLDASPDAGAGSADAPEGEAASEAGSEPTGEHPTRAPAAAAAPAAPLDERALERRLAAAQARLQRMEGVNLGAPEEYDALHERLTFLRSQQEDLGTAVADLEASIRRMNAESRRRFRETFDQVNEKFQALFPRVFGGGEARLVLTDSEDALVAGVDIEAQPPGKKLQSLNLLSGGEKALTAISLIFSFFLHKPSPFCLLDEVDAPLDDVNVTRFNRLIESMTDHSQFIIITHNKRTMEVADRLYGVTMEEAGVSKIVSVNLTGAA
jgi:chromosome segregation protein